MLQVQIPGGIPDLLNPTPTHSSAARSVVRELIKVGVDIEDQLNQVAVEAALDPHGSVRALTCSLSEQAAEELEGDLG